MKKLLIPAILLALATNLRAQETPDQGFGTLDDLKMRVDRLLEENKKLKAEYQDVYAEHQRLQGLTNQYGSQIEKLRDNSKNMENTRKGQKGKLAYLKEDLEKAQGDILLKETKNALLKGNLLDVDDQQRLLKLQYADLEYQKRELEMELQLKTIDVQDKALAQEKELQALKLQLQDSLGQEAQLAYQLKEIETTTVGAPQKAEQLEKENKELESRVMELERQVEFKTKENSLLKDKELLNTKSLENGLSSREEKKKDLQKKVDALEAKYNKLNQDVETSLTDQNKRKELTQKVIEIDKENQNLRDKIAELTEKIEKLKF